MRRQSTSSALLCMIVIWWEQARQGRSERLLGGSSASRGSTLTRSPAEMSAELGDGREKPHAPGQARDQLWGASPAVLLSSSSVPWLSTCHTSARLAPVWGGLIPVLRTCRTPSSTGGGKS